MTDNNSLADHDRLTDDERLSREVEQAVERRKAVEIAASEAHTTAFIERDKAAALSRVKAAVAAQRRARGK